MRDRMTSVQVRCKTTQSCLNAKAMLRFLAAIALTQCFLIEAANVPNVAPERQQQPNPTPVPENQLRFPAGRTKNSDPEQSEIGDSSICFPYFISQDIEALLAQAIRMLDRAADQRQKGWLLIFVQKLDSLSRQLRSLPVKHKNMCFQSRERLEGDKSLDDHDDDDDILSAIPDDIQLHYAKKLFNANMEPPRQRIGHEMYITGKVFDRQVPNGPRTNSKRFHIPSHHQAGTTPVGRDIQIQEVHSNAFTTNQPSVINPNHRNPGGYLYRETVPIGYWPGPSMTYENMPFLPRSTRKTIPRPLIDKMKYRPHSSTNESPQDGTDGQAQAAPTSHPVTTTAAHIQSKTLAQSDDTPNSRAAAKVSVGVNHEAQQQQQQQQHEPSRQLVRVPLTGTAESNAPKATEQKLDRAHSAEVHQEEKMAKESVATGKDIEEQAYEEKRKQPSPSTDSGNKQDYMQEPHQNANGASKHDQQFMVGRGQLVDYPVTYGRYEDYRLVPHRPSLNYDTNLDFEYEEQGAAAGELYATDDENSAKHLAVPPAPQLTNSLEPNAATNQNPSEADDAVRQLHELKSSNKINMDPAMANQQTSRVYPTQTTQTGKAHRGAQ